MADTPTSCIWTSAEVTAVVPIEDLELIEALEDARDLDDVRAALADPENRERIAWDDLKVQLGL